MSCGCGCGGEVVAYEEWDEENVSAAEYQGRKVTLNKPFRTKGANKKFGVYTKNEKGNVVLVRFGDPNMEIKRDDPERRKSFRSRHNCDSPGPKWKARYWSCRQWRSGPKVEASEEPCGCGCEEDTVEAAEPTPKDGESHDEYMSRCMEMGYSKEECMKAHEGHEFEVEGYYDEDKKKKKKYAKSEDDPCTSGYEQYGMKMKNGRKVPNCIPIKKKAEAEFQVCSSCTTQSACAEAGECKAEASYHSCPSGEKMVDGECRKVAVTIELEIDEMKAIVEASTGKTIVEIRGVAFHEGMNKNKWSLTTEGAKALVSQMEGADLTLNHPEASEHGVGFTRNMDGGVEEAVVGYIQAATFHTTPDGGYEVRYVAHVVRPELFEALESGLWSRDEYGVSIGGSGVPVSADDNGVVFGEDFTFDHLAIVHKPAYPRATIESVRRIEKEEEMKATFISHSDSGVIQNNQKMVSAMTDEITDTTNLENEIEALKADLVLASSRVAEFEATEAARIEADRMTLVERASEMGMSGHDDLKAETLETLIASWEASHPEPTPVVMESVESEPSAEIPVEASEAPRSVVANYLNGKMVETDESIYARAWNAWAKAWNGTLAVDEKARMAAPRYEEMKEMN